jgi:hypothetical protein
MTLSPDLSDLTIAARDFIAEWDALYPQLPRDDRFEDLEFASILRLRRVLERPEVAALLTSLEQPE